MTKCKACGKWIDGLVHTCEEIKMNEETPTPLTNEAIRRCAIAACPESFIATEMAKIERENAELKETVENKEKALRLIDEQRDLLRQQLTEREDALAERDKALRYFNEKLTELDGVIKILERMADGDPRVKHPQLCECHNCLARKALSLLTSPVTDNPKEDKFYEKVEKETGGTK